MTFAKRIARNYVFPLALNLGVDKVIRSISAHNTLNVLYHGVSVSDPNYYSPTNIAASMFEKQLIYFKKNFDIVTLKEAFEMKRNAIIPKRKTITISFDDGYKNNLDIALPLLEKLEIPATFFVCSVITQPDESNYLWSDLIYCLKHLHKELTFDIDGHVFHNYYEKSTNLPIENFIKSIPTMKQRDEFLGELLVRFDLVNNLKEIPSELWKLMSNDELKRFSQSKFVEIGSHGHLHYNLGLITPGEAKIELEKSKLLLETSLQKKISMVAYPDGSYTSEVKNIAAEVGYDYQLAVDFRCQEDSSDARIMGRYGISTTTTYESAIINTNIAIGKYGFN